MLQEAFSMTPNLVLTTEMIGYNHEKNSFDSRFRDVFRATGRNAEFSAAMRYAIAGMVGSSVVAQKMVGKFSH